MLLRQFILKMNRVHSLEYCDGAIQCFQNDSVELGRLAHYFLSYGMLRVCV